MSEVGVTVDDEAVALQAGDTLVLPSGVRRQMIAVADASLLVCGYGDVVVVVPGEDVPRGTPPWIG